MIHICKSLVCHVNIYFSKLFKNTPYPLVLPVSFIFKKYRISINHIKAIDNCKYSGSTSNAAHISK